MADDGSLGLGGAIGSGLNAFTQSYMAAKKLAMDQSAQQVGLLNQGYKLNPDSGQYEPTEEKQNQLALAKAQTNVQMDSLNPKSDRSVMARNQAKTMAEQYVPGSSSLINDNMSEYELMNTVLPRLKDMQEAKYKGQVNALDIGNKVKELNKPDEGSAGAATAFRQAKDANDAVNTIEQNTNFDPTSTGSAIQGLLPSKFLQSPDYKAHEAAKAQFIGAYTAWRKQRGENPEAADVIENRYFSQPGEGDDKTKALKSQARQDFVDSLKTQAGTYANNSPQSVHVKKSFSAAPQFTSDVTSYAKQHKISNSQALAIKMQRTQSSSGQANQSPADDNGG
jgi:hypothetical protein